MTGLSLDGIVAWSLGYTFQADVVHFLKGGGQPGKGEGSRFRASEWGGGGQPPEPPFV